MAVACFVSVLLLPLLPKPLPLLLPLLLLPLLLLPLLLLPLLLLPLLLLPLLLLPLLLLPLLLLLLLLLAPTPLSVATLVMVVESFSSILHRKHAKSSQHALARMLNLC
jgi:hypothetical protein